ncbi:hypothetical protein BCF74_11551 [Knoellia remsis]|uniref:Uncharacterized protein n=1 Tax=Knoellia remsis TaxID=407159 RepID=A0A2T0UI73_9MICO|nr:hypothetical protein [Knoellia remsis]PRY57537.1 hypothetical protein BCF74_11551 [Knoellia remsis]
MWWIVLGIVVLIAVTAWWLGRRGSTGVSGSPSTDTVESAIARGQAVRDKHWGGGI